MDKELIEQHISFETLTALFFQLTEERYPSAEKAITLISPILQTMTTQPKELLPLKIGVLNVMRDMIREVSPRYLYRSIEHRDDLYKALLEALEGLEEEWEEMQEEEEDGS